MSTKLLIALQKPATRQRACAEAMRDQTAAFRFADYSPEVDNENHWPTRNHSHGN